MLANLSGLGNFRTSTRIIQKKPGLGYSGSMYDNPNLTEADRKGYEDRWASDPEGREVELMASVP